MMGRRYTADEALRWGIIVHASCPDVLSKAAEMADGFVKEDLDGAVISQMKNDLYYNLCKTLSQPTAYYSKI